MGGWYLRKDSQVGCQPLYVMPLPTVQLVTGEKGYVTSGDKVLEECIVDICSQFSTQHDVCTTN